MAKVQVSKITPHLGWYSRIKLSGKDEEIIDYINEEYHDQMLETVEKANNLPVISILSPVWNDDETKCLIAIASEYAIARKIDDKKWEIIVFSSIKYKDVMSIMINNAAEESKRQGSKTLKGKDREAIVNLQKLNYFDTAADEVKEKFEDEGTRRERKDSVDVFIFEPKYGLLLDELWIAEADISPPPPTLEELQGDQNPRKMKEKRWGDSYHQDFFI